ncbi:MAG TPA: methyltransferase domain-containing protein [Terracidiphilus sp.]
MPSWNPDLYLQFANQRTRPAWDLANRVRNLLKDRADRPLRIVDLGCGPGNSTAVLADSFPGAEIIGLDSSAEMIDQARATSVPASWVVADLQAWQPATTFDLVFSNAVLHWVPDQGKLLATLTQWLVPGGVIAIQVPANHTSSLYKALLATAASAKWQDSFSGMSNPLYFHEPDFYFEKAKDHCHEVDIWETTYWHLLKDHQAIIDWYAGTGMRPWLDCLLTEAQADFKQDILVRAAPEYPVRDDGSVFFPFRRLFFTMMTMHNAS